jgi:hypothetical protein
MCLKISALPIWGLALLACIAVNAQDAPVAAWQQGPFACYEVQALSSIQRLPNAAPTDGRLSARLRMIAAKGEYEPASFVIVPRQDVTKLELKASALVGAGGNIPAANVDIKVVKCWYQGGTAWYSYFGDSERRELTPELLLSDETLVRVDTEKKENYLRVGNEYVWISYLSEKAEKFFNYFTEPVADSKTIQPVTLTKGENKQIWITVKVPQDAAAGLYEGNIDLVADGVPAGAMKLAVKVLPYELPSPKTYYNLDNDFLVTLYGTGIYDQCERMGIPLAFADKQQMAIYQNLIAHNVVNCRSDMTLANKADRAKAIAGLRHELRMMKAAGLVMKPLLSRGWAYWAGENNIEAFKARIDALVDTLKSEVDHDDIYITSWDEAYMDRIKVMRELVEYVNSKGIKLWVTTRPGDHFDYAGYCIDYANHGGWPTREQAQTWHTIGAKVASYAGPHTGPENPDVFRRWEGMARYKANYDGSFNYMYFTALHSTLYERQKANVWNDFSGGAFRGFNLVYPTIDGVVDTIAWEGLREGIDDIRYATKLKQEAAKAIAGGKLEAVSAAKKALIWLELVDEKTADLNAVRLEMIDRISKIQQAMEPKP